MDEINKFTLKLPYLDKSFNDHKSIRSVEVGKVYLDDKEIGLCRVANKNNSTGRGKTKKIEYNHIAEVLLATPVTQELFVYYKGYHSEDGEFTFEGLLFKTEHSLLTKRIVDLLT